MTKNNEKKRRIAFRLSRLVLFLSVVAMAFSSCTKDGNTIYVDDDEEIKNDTRPVVYFIYGEGEMGDMGYIDALYRGVVNAAGKGGMLLSLAELPADETKVDYALNYFLNYMKSVGSNRRALVVIANNNYEPLLEHYRQTLVDNSNVDILLAESDDTSLPVNTVYFPQYGACYLAGRLAGEAMTDVDRVLVAMANNNNTVLTEMRDGFVSGLHDGNPEAVTSDRYMSDDKWGYDRADSAYVWSYDIDRNYDMVLPLCGGTAQGFLRYNREHPGSFYTVGIDADMQAYSTRVPFSVVKHIDTAVEEWIEKWLKGEKPEQHQTLGLGSGYTELVVSGKYSSQLAAKAKQLLPVAIEKETKYESK